MTTIVVGVDGSEPGSEALRWAADEAALRGAELVAVHAWDYPYLGTMDLVGLDDRFREAAEQAAREVLDAAVAELRRQHPEHRERIRGELVQGSPGWSLVQRAAEADLLVVGSRGRGGFRGLLLGSVSQIAANHATVPVVVVRGPAEG